MDCLPCQYVIRSSTRQIRSRGLRHLLGGDSDRFCDARRKRNPHLCKNQTRPSTLRVNKKWTTLRRNSVCRPPSHIRQNIRKRPVCCPRSPSPVVRRRHLISLRDFCGRFGGFLLERRRSFRSCRSKSLRSFGNLLRNLPIRYVASSSWRTSMSIRNECRWSRCCGNRIWKSFFSPLSNFCRKFHRDVRSATTSPISWRSTSGSALSNATSMLCAMRTIRRWSCGS
jgi:hypothetical protein